MAAVFIQDIDKRFGDTLVLHKISLDVKDGEFLTLLGPSGCGKSTLLRIVAGLEAADRGNIHIDGQIVNGVRPKDRNVAMVFQTYALYPHLSVRANIALPLRLRCLSPAQRLPLLGRLLPRTKDRLREIDADVASVTRQLGLEQLIDRRPGQLSGGQRQRVALARAMVRHPAVFLMDEPLSNLDAERRTSMRAELSSLHRRLGTTFIYVTHDQTEAMTLSNRIAVMNDGKISQIGTPQDIYDRPRTLEVARFVGSPKINLFRVNIVDGYARLGEHVLCKLLQDMAAGEWQIGVRPEHIAVVQNGTPRALPATVRLVEHLGSELNIRCHIAVDGTDIMVRQSASGGILPKPGDVVSLTIDPSGMHFFDGQGLRHDSTAVAHLRAAAYP